MVCGHFIGTNRSTDSMRGHKVYPNLLPEMTITGTNQLWTAEKLVYPYQQWLCLLGCDFRSISQKSDWLVDIENNRFASKNLCSRDGDSSEEPKVGVTHHLDRAVQYFCEDYIKTLKNNYFHISCLREGNPYDNAWTDNFRKTCKTTKCIYVGLRNLFGCSGKRFIFY